MDRLPKKELHGQSPVVTFPTKQALLQVITILNISLFSMKLLIYFY